jgi:hypothetical protein
MHFDRKRPFTWVADMEPIAYRQNGHYFYRSGAPADEMEMAAVIRPPPSPAPEASVTTAPIITQLGHPAKVAADDMRLKENKALKFQMEAFGEPWQSAAHARKFLGIE